MFNFSSKNIFWISYSFACLLTCAQTSYAATPAPSAVNPPFKAQCDMSATIFPCDFGSSNFGSLLGPGFGSSGQANEKGTFQLISANQQHGSPIRYTYAWVGPNGVDPTTTLTFNSLYFDLDDSKNEPGADSLDPAWHAHYDKDEHAFDYSCTPTASDTCPMSNVPDNTNQHDNDAMITVNNEMGANGPTIAAYATSNRAPTSSYAAEAYDYALIKSSSQENPSQPVPVAYFDNGTTTGAFEHDTQQYIRLHLENCKSGVTDVFVKNFFYNTPSGFSSGISLSRFYVSCDGATYAVKAGAECGLATCDIDFTPANSQSVLSPMTQRGPHIILRK